MNLVIHFCINAPSSFLSLLLSFFFIHSRSMASAASTATAAAPPPAFDLVDDMLASCAAALLESPPDCRQAEAVARAAAAICDKHAKTHAAHVEASAASPAAATNTTSVEYALAVLRLKSAAANVLLAQALNVRQSESLTGERFPF